MQRVKCVGCRKEFPATETFRMEGRVLCQDCVNSGPPIPMGQILRNVDPTICGRCGTDWNQELAQDAGLPLCGECHDFVMHRPLPGWVQGFYVLLAAMVAFSLWWNFRFIQAYAEIQKANAAFDEDRMDVASSLMSAASRRVPEDDHLSTAAAFYEAMRLYGEDKSRQALALFLPLRGRVPPEANLETWIKRAQSDVAYEAKDYAGFTAIALELMTAQPDDPMNTAMVASGYSLQYAQTGKGGFKRQAVEFVDRAEKQGRNGKEGPCPPCLAKYIERIRHRLATREILRAQEYDTRFPNGWKPKEGKS